MDEGRGASSSCLGGGSCLLIGYDDWAQIVFDLSHAFEGGTPTQFAQDHLLVPAQVPGEVPEPASLLLVATGVAGTMFRRRTLRR